FERSVCTDIWASFGYRFLPPTVSPSPAHRTMGSGRHSGGPQAPMSGPARRRFASVVPAVFVADARCDRDVDPVLQAGEPDAHADDHADHREHGTGAPGLLTEHEDPGAEQRRDGAELLAEHGRDLE